MRIRLRRPSKPTTFAILMVAATLAALLPATRTQCVGGALQAVTPITWVIHTGTRQTLEAAQSLNDAPPTRAELERLRRENERLARQVGQQQVMIDQTDRRVTELAGLREQLGDLHARIIFASICGRSTSPERESLTISKGRRHGVEVGDWVAAGSSSARRDATATGRDLLLQQWLLGQVCEVQPHLSIVQLTTDPHFGPQRVWAARALDDGGWRVADQDCGLVGSGGGGMRIDRAPADYHAQGHTIVLLPLARPRPMALAIGRIVASETLETGLHYDLEVEPWGRPTTLSHVYVISLSR
jgi:cell shape-determining protein MreC